jgi:glycine hydroxymethyltransferase
MREPEMRQIAKWMAEVIRHRDNPAVASRVRGEVRELCQHFPIYEDLVPDRAEQVAEGAVRA